MSAYDALRLELLFIETDGLLQSEAADAITKSAERCALAIGADAQHWRLGAGASDPLISGRLGFELWPPDHEQIGAVEAWSHAHALAVEIPGARAEPVFTGDVKLDDISSGGGTESAPGDETGPADVRWHFSQIRVVEAHASLRSRQLPLGAGITIGHPDTGYTDHPDILGNDGPVDPGHGLNLLELGTPPRDPLQPGFMDQPGHGTATSSVMIARDQITVVRDSAPAEQVDLAGIAPDAKVFPFRVTETVIILGWQRRLAMAIEAAVDARASVISMSLGGIGGSRLDRAIRYAESHGVIVVAAAGNVVPFVVSPATHPLVVACAASRADECPWSKSAHGSAVDITAPGHDVWVAGWRDTTPVARRGSGTSFATAAVASAAALWLCAKRAELGGRTAELPRLFRRALRDTARRVTTLPAGKYGAGILDCDALVRAPLPAGGEEGTVEAAPLLLHQLQAALEPERELTTDATASTAAMLARHLDTATQSELAFHLLLDPALREAWSHTTESVAQARVPQRASPRLKQALRTAMRPADAPVEGSPPPSPRTTLSAPRAPEATSPGDEVVRIVIELDIIVRVEDGR